MLSYHNEYHSAHLSLCKRSPDSFLGLFLSVLEFFPFLLFLFLFFGSGFWNFFLPFVPFFCFALHSFLSFNFFVFPIFLGLPGFQYRRLWRYSGDTQYFSMVFQSLRQPVMAAQAFCSVGLWRWRTMMMQAMLVSGHMSLQELRRGKHY